MNTTPAANDPGQPTPNAERAITSVDLPTPSVALAIGAHPDDIEFGCGATLAKWAAAGCRIHHLVLTDGSKGTWNPDADISELIRSRRAEQSEAARRLGGRDEVTFLDQVDGELVESVELRSRIARHIRTVRPDVVLGHDPWKRRAPAASSAAVPLRSLGNLSGDEERLRLAYSLWCAGLVSVVVGGEGPRAGADKAKKKNNNKRPIVPAAAGKKNKRPR